MRKTFKLLLVTLLIVCFTSTLMACSNNNNVTDNNETTTTAEKVTTTEPPTTTEEPTTEEPSTEYQYKGKEIQLLEAVINIDKIDNLTLEKGSKIYINDICNNDVDDIDRGGIAYSLVVSILKEKNPEYFYEFEDKYLPPGSPRYKVPYSDNYYIEYIYDNSVTFHYVKTSARGYAYFDLY